MKCKTSNRHFNYIILSNLDPNNDNFENLRCREVYMDVCGRLFGENSGWDQFYAIWYGQSYEVDKRVVSHFYKLRKSGFFRNINNPEQFLNSIFVIKSTPDKVARTNHEKSAKLFETLKILSSEYKYLDTDRKTLVYKYVTPVRNTNLSFGKGIFSNKSYIFCINDDKEDRIIFEDCYNMAEIYKDINIFEEQFEFMELLWMFHYNLFYRFSNGGLFKNIKNSNPVAIHECLKFTIKKFVKIYKPYEKKFTESIEKLHDVNYRYYGR